MIALQFTFWPMTHFEAVFHIGYELGIEPPFFDYANPTAPTTLLKGLFLLC